MIFGRRRPRIDVNQTGTADAGAGGVAITGVNLAPITVHAVPIARSHYLVRVAEIAPPRLLERDRELAELAAFCTAADPAPTYRWWRAPAWAGKSALLSWLVLHPPERVRVVSFFITARYAAQSGRVAFVEVVLEQLAEMLGEPLPALLTETTREAHLLGMFARAAAGCLAAGERLVLVVDGLDEDRGVTTGPDAYSVAALLPVRPPAGMRVVVSGRLQPPIPTDVADGHPLRDPAIVRALAASPYAAAVRQDAERELQRLLHGGRSEQDLLGLVTAAGGGLSGADLAELTDGSEQEIGERLGAVSGRTFATRTAQWSPATTVYLLAHEELVRWAEKAIDAAALDGYRQRLHGWADAYRRREWPPGTPEYLLRGYFRVLQLTGDVPRMVACATDVARHRRMSDASGGDGAALVEIAGTMDRLQEAGRPDLSIMCRLVVHRDTLTLRNTNVPAGLPSLWARLGHPARAEALAGSMADPVRQAAALAGVVEALAEVGDLERAADLADSIADPQPQSRALAAVASAHAAAGAADRAYLLVGRAEKAARGTPERDEREAALDELVWVLIGVARALAAAGDRDRVLVQRGISAARLEDHRYDRVMAALAGVLARTGDHDATVALVEHAASNARDILDIRPKALAVAGLASVLVGSGDLDAARSLVERFIADPEHRAAALAELAPVAVAVGNLDGGLVLARTINHPEWQASAYCGMAWALAVRGDVQSAQGLVDRWLAPQVQAWARIGVAWVLAATDQLDTARRFVTHSISDAFHQAYAFAGMAWVQLSVGDRADVRRLAGEAETASRAVPDPESRAAVMADLALVVAVAGDLDRAWSIADGAAQAAYAIIEPDRRAEALAGRLTGRLAATLLVVARAAAHGGAPEPAHVLAARTATAARALNDANQRIEVVEDLIGLLGISGTSALSRTLADDLEHDDASADVLLTWRLGVAAEASVDAGDPDRCRMLVQVAAGSTSGIVNLTSRIVALVGLASVLVHAGDADGAMLLADEAELTGRAIADPDEQTAVFEYLRNARRWLGDQDGAGVSNGQRRRARAEIPDLLVTAAAALAEHGDTDHARVLAGLAESEARTATSRNRQAAMAADLARVLAAAGDLDQAESLARSIPDVETERTRALACVARSLVAAGWLDRAEIVIAAIADPVRQGRELATLAQAVATTGDPGHACALVDRAMVLMGEAGHPLDVAGGLTGLVSAAGAAGDLGRARDIATQAETAARRDKPSHLQAVVLGRLAGALVGLGDPVRAEALARSVPDPFWVADALSSVATALVTEGDPERGEAIARSISEPYRRAAALTELSLLSSAARDLARARALAREAQTLIAGEVHLHELALPGIIRALAAAGDLEQARTLADHLEQARTLADHLNTLTRRTKPTDEYVPLSIARAHIAVGDPARAEAVVRSIADPQIQARALVGLADLVEPVRAARLLARALRLGDWHDLVDGVARVQPAALRALAAEFTHVTAGQMDPLVDDATLGDPEPDETVDETAELEQAWAQLRGEIVAAAAAVYPDEEPLVTRDEGPVRTGPVEDARRRELRPWPTYSEKVDLEYAVATVGVSIPAPMDARDPQTPEPRRWNAVDGLSRLARGLAERGWSPVQPRFDIGRWDITTSRRGQSLLATMREDDGILRITAETAHYRRPATAGLGYL